MLVSSKNDVTPQEGAQAGGSAGLLFLSLKTTLDLLLPADVVRIAEEVFADHDEGDVIWSAPRMLTAQGPQMRAKFRTKLCALTRLPALGFRVTSAIPGAEHIDGGPTRLVLLSDPDNGEFRAIVDERWNFALRTGAGAAVALKYLHGADTSTVGLIGAGHMARGTIFALLAALPKLSKVYVTSRSPQSREKLASELGLELGIEIVPVATTEEVLARADAVVVSTSAKAPFISESWLRPGCTIYSMGANQELDTDSYLKVDKFIADDWGQVQLKPDMVELMGKGIFSQANVYADMPPIVTGRKPGRERADERILIRSEGLVTMDVALAHHLYHLALARGLGQVLHA